MREVKLRIQRFDPSKDKKPAFQEYTVPTGEAMTVLEALLYAKAYIDHSIALRYSCRMSSCGSCGMMIDGKPKLACETQLAALRGPEITIKPMDNFPIIRDLVVDLEDFFARHREIMPHLERSDTGEQEHPTGEYLMKPEELEPILQFTYCIKCGLCSSSCPTAATDTLFSGPQALAQAYRYLMDVRDEAGAERLELVNTAHGVWGCHFAGSCSAVCPKGVDPSLGIQLLRRHVMAARPPRGKGEGAKLHADPDAVLDR
jgi:succinate dehydrogenase / fumarate reductase iron-sulfur subunit